MRRADFLLIATWRFCAAQSPRFSIHDDLLAHPPFDIIFSESYISETEALALLKSPTPTSVPDSTATAETDLSSGRPSERANAGRGAGNTFADHGDEVKVVSETYELINASPSKYLCAIPVFTPSPPLTETASEIAKAELQREVNRASARGWELMGGLNGQCLYFMSGWWSYQFCYGKDVVQFHALPPTDPRKPGPPRKDPQSQEYVLGIAADEDDQIELRRGEEGKTAPNAPVNTELQIKGDQRYLVQRLQGGTLCDLTNRDRTIEVQYHCAPSSVHDRIAWIKEVTTCTYLMMVYTPRLCADVAFLPPKQTHANSILCRPVVSSEEEVMAWESLQHTIDGAAGQKQGGKGAAPHPQHEQDEGWADGSSSTGSHVMPGMTGGNVVIGGGQETLGTSDGDTLAATLTPPRQLRDGAEVNRDNPIAEILALARAKARVPGPEENPEFINEAAIERMDLDPEAIQALAEKLKNLAGDKRLRLEIFEGADAIDQIKTMINDADASEAGQKEGMDDNVADDKAKGGRKQRVTTMNRQALKKHRSQDQKGTEDMRDKKKSGEQEQHGSEERFFKDEL